MANRIIRFACAAAFCVAIPGMIVSSIAGNNEGWVLLFGLTGAVGALVLLAVSASSTRTRLDVFDDARAAKIERRIGRMVAAGADEADLRTLVRESVDLGHSAKQRMGQT